MTQIKDIIRHLETIAPPAYQESYDNAGLITGSADWEVKGVLCCLDSTEAVIEEAVRKGCNLVVAHHPIVFKGLKRFTGKTYVERVVMAAIKRDVAVYAVHTNLDNVYLHGVNAGIADTLGLLHTRILAPKSVLKRAAVIDAQAHTEETLWRAGATHVVRHTGGQSLDCIFPLAAESAVAQALRATGARLMGIQPVEDPDARTGAGMIGELPRPVDAREFLLHLKTVMKAGVVRHTALPEKPVQRIAVCGGAGGFLLPHALAQGADVFVTADYKYHEFFDADGRIVIADIGHFESEQFTINLLRDIISEKFRTFAAYCTEVRTNPVFYL